MSAGGKAKEAIDDTRTALAELGLDHAAERLTDLVSDAVKDNLAAHRFLDVLLRTEFEYREERRIETLATCAYIREHATVWLAGPPGVGKTHLAIALGVKATESGFSVAFYRLEDRLYAMKRDAEVPPQRLRGKKYLKVSLLIIDELGFQPLSRQEASLFFRLVSYRYQRGSTILTTTKSIQDWPEILAGDEVMTTAILDRLLHRSHVLSIRGRSYRLRDLEKTLKCAEIRKRLRRMRAEARSQGRTTQDSR